VSNLQGGRYSGPQSSSQKLRAGGISDGLVAWIAGAGEEFGLSDVAPGDARYSGTDTKRGYLSCLGA
jgi:hypothetical protein